MSNSFCEEMNIYAVQDMNEKYLRNNMRGRKVWLKQNVIRNKPQ